MKTLPVPLAPVIELSEDVIETSAGAATVIYVNIEGTPTPQVVWSKDGEYIDEKDFKILSEGSLYIPITRPQDSGTFTVTAANCNGQSSVEVQVEVAVQTAPSRELCLYQPHHTQWYCVYCMYCVWYIHGVHVDSLLPDS